MEAFLLESTPANFVLSYCAADCQAALLHLSEVRRTLDAQDAAHHLLSRHASVSAYHD